MFLNVVGCGNTEDSSVSVETSGIILEESQEELKGGVLGENWEDTEEGNIEDTEAEVDTSDETIVSSSITSSSNGTSSSSTNSSTSDGSHSGNSSTSGSVPTRTCNYNIPIVEKIVEVGHYETVTITAAWTETINHPTVTEQKYVIDTPASEKTVGYECSCGKTK